MSVPGEDMQWKRTLATSWLVDLILCRSIPEPSDSIQVNVLKCSNPLSYYKGLLGSHRALSYVVATSNSVLYINIHRKLSVVARDIPVDHNHLASGSVSLS